ncbi:flagellar basal-body rod protein FlgG [Cupriavidus sp. SW-Y-13]|uniref:flagellar basal-body rod protein FlgG n=1 Tax=Cupriavidus sp. SW-Y-13 TaxID=2653854 RepID=UPI0013664012|nr:flagellar basal-body rod protein FlgG [Cupriavidus sp. SW-Y-13]MWL90533.1 flagellar basal-body rod protein FlgG [Cupriavidus sp. SW-Y-13]
MLDALHIAATGMQSQQTNVDTIANNLANVNTPGFKKSRVSFTDLVSQETRQLASTGIDAVAGLGAATRTGMGVGVASMGRVLDVGDLKKTDSPYDIAIAGQGFIEVQMPDGSRAFTRGGTLKVNPDGMLSTLGGYPLKPGIAIPENATDMTITADGHVMVRVSGQSTATDAGQLELVKFPNASAITPMGDNLYRTNDNTGEPIAMRAGDDGMSQIQQGFVESSNVKLVDEMVSLMVAQRAYEANVKIAQASDEMLGMINNLRR